jgi:hypothetical protein
LNLRRRRTRPLPGDFADDYSCDDLVDGILGDRLADRFFGVGGRNSVDCRLGGIQSCRDGRNWVGNSRDIRNGFFEFSDRWRFNGRKSFSVLWCGGGFHFFCGLRNLLNLDDLFLNHSDGLDWMHDILGRSRGNRNGQIGNRIGDHCTFRINNYRGIWNDLKHKHSS